MEDSYKFFQNKGCKYFPCHDLEGEFNCLFCYCPLYRIENCHGNHTFFEKDGKRIKVCTNCTFPHKPENYEKMMEMLMQADGYVKMNDW